MVKRNLETRLMRNEVHSHMTVAFISKFAPGMFVNDEDFINSEGLTK